MKIPFQLIPTAYEISKKVYENELTLSDGTNQLVSKGMNKSSARDYIYDFRYLMQGKKFSRTLNTDSMEYFFSNLRKDYGTTQLTKPLSALIQHIEYYEGQQKHKTTMHQMRAIHKKYSEQVSSPTNTYLFVWNPDKWKWTTLEKAIEEIQNSGKSTERWSCRSYKTIKPGDRVFLARVGSEPRGIFAAGYVSSEPFLSKHWSGEDKDVFRVLIDFEVLLNPDKEPILTTDILKIGNLSKQQWTPQSSGISIRQELVEELEAVWFDFLTTQKIRFNPFTPTENQVQQTFTEGTATQVTQTRYERNPFARAQCLKHFGYKCSVCEFDFADYYGEIGKNFIHVHHLIQIATVKKTYSVDPINDLRPVCPNCHAMIHRQNPALTIEELKSRVKN